jgi:hypothetical protein
MSHRRRGAALALVVLIVVGMLPPRAWAQQPAPSAAQSSTPAVVEVMPPDSAPGPRADIYDVGAGVLTAARLPFNVALCGLGAVAGSALFFLTLGTAYRATTRTFEEGCGQRWILRGDDIRPRGAPGIMPEMSTDLSGYRR